jgi:long-chain acyl-CoA synthetase
MNEPIWTFYEILTENARQSPEQPAVIEQERSYTHAEFLVQVDRLAAGISTAGLQAGDRIAVLAQNSIEYMELYGACAKLGTVAYPINWRLTAEEVGAVLSLAEPSMLIVGAEHLAQLEGLDLEAIKARIAMMDSPPAGFRAFAELYGEPGSADSPTSPDDVFVIISTAAVAGVPRGAMLTHANLVTVSQQLIGVFGLDSSDRHLAALPLFHLTGMNLSLGILVAGGANVITPAFDPGLSAQMIDTHAVTVLADFPPVLEMLMEARGEASWESLRAVFGLDSPEMIMRLQSETGARFWTGFGQAETSGLVTIGPADERPGSAGKPLPMAEVRLVDDLEEQVPVGQPGEIVVRSPLVFAGYWNDPAATEFAARGGWHHTGDVGRFDEDGYLYYVARKPEKALIKTGGENVYPAEVEQVLLKLPQVAAVAVIGVPDEKWGEAVKAVIELKPGERLSSEEAIAAVAEQIASYKKPRHIVFVEALPRDDAGEVDRERVQGDYR